MPTLLIHLPQGRASALSSSDEVASASNVSHKRLSIFTCRNVNQSIHLWREIHDWHFLLLMCSACECRKSKHDSYQNVLLNTVLWLKGNYLCIMHRYSQLYWQRRKLFHWVTVSSFSSWLVHWLKFIYITGGKVHQHHWWKSAPVNFALQVRKVLSNGKTNRLGKNYWKFLLESLLYHIEWTILILVNLITLLLYPSHIKMEFKLDVDATGTK